MSRVVILMIEILQSYFEFSNDQRSDKRSVEKKEKIRKKSREKSKQMFK
jgi:hypothetical protein